MPLAAGAAAADLPGESALRAWRERRTRVCAAGATALRTNSQSAASSGMVPRLQRNRVIHRPQVGKRACAPFTGSGRENCNCTLGEWLSQW